MSRLRDWWLTRRWPWWLDAMKVARDLDAEAGATFTDDKALGLGRVAPASANRRRRRNRFRCCCLSRGRR
jgi:hypothetical protein